jgi:hypothetical protein
MGTRIHKVFVTEDVRDRMGGRQKRMMMTMMMMIDICNA